MIRTLLRRAREAVWQTERSCPPNRPLLAAMAAAATQAPCLPSLKSSFISVGCNRLVNVLDWSSSGLIAYAAGAMVALYEPQRRTVVRTLLSHTKRVNVVRWLPGVSGDSLQLVSAGADKCISFWTVSSDAKVCVLDLKLDAHLDSISALSSVRLRSGDLLVASTSADCTVAIWRRSAEASWTKVQSLSMKPRQPECVALWLVDDVPLLAVGGTDPILRLWVWDTTSQQFGKCYELHGHEDWIRTLAFCTCPNGDVLLASSGQDNYIRLWRITSLSSPASTSGLQVGKNVTMPLASGGSLSVTLDSVLSGHEDWVYSVAWRPPVRRTINGDEKTTALMQPMELLSTSMDRTTVLWAPVEESETMSGEGLWTSRARMGEMGGNTLGFYGAVWSPTGEHILAHGYTGAMHLWHRKDESGTEWEPQVAPSGHFMGVEDVVWDPSQTYFVSTSTDQTTRAFACWTRGAGATNVFHEIARPLTHGFDMACAAFVRNVPHRLVLGAEEKLLRVFDAPVSFVNTLEHLTGVKAATDPVSRVLGAAQPPLGLSNKPITSLDSASLASASDAPKTQFEDEEPDQFDDRPPPIVAQGFQMPPFEEQLMQGTLWPEIQKIYGHGNQLYCVASSNAGHLIASACHGTKQHECVVRLTETTSGLWKECATLASHRNTVTQLHFSQTDKYLLAVSRDRGITVWLVGAGANARQVWKQDEAHERIIWGGEWAPDEVHFATGSRDKHLKIWAKQNDQEAWQVVHDVTFAAPVTTVSWLPCSSQQLASRGLTHVVLAGLENGALFFVARTAAGVWQAAAAAVPAELGHQADVKRASWRVVGDTTVEVVTCSADHSVRLWTVTWPAC